MGKWSHGVRAGQASSFERGEKLKRDAIFRAMMGYR